jgi:SNF2 family DNA or RNA helicase
MGNVTFLDKTIELLAAIPDISELCINPSLFSSDTIEHDCDECEASPRNRGDCFDEHVCFRCWEDAITKAYEDDK